jgi:hypothetical protein
MSWIFGFAARPGHRGIERMRGVHPSPVGAFRSDQLYVACGGPDATCRFDIGDEEGWIHCGVLLEPGDQRKWTLRDRSPSNPTEAAGGHYVSVRWTPDGLSASTDPLGLRALYYRQTDDGLYFSTRLEWLASATGNTRIDLPGLGSRLLMFSQLSAASGVEGIERLGPGGRLTYSRGALTVEHLPWSPTDLETTTGTVDLLEHVLEGASNPLRDGVPADVSLALSGGVDSRLVLALSGRHPGFRAHVFGFADEPDVLAAERLAARLGIELIRYGIELPDPSKSLEMLVDYAGLASGFSFASQLIEKRHYAEICRHGGMLYGLSGEIYRRQILNRFLYSGGRKAVRDGDLDAMTRLLLKHPSALLRPEAADTLTAGAAADLESAFSTMPSARRIGVENWVDLLMTRYSVSNAHMGHQSLVDHFGWGYSPFEQTPCLDVMFAIPARARAGGAALKRLIAHRDGMLSKAPLVMNDATYPFWMPPLAATIWTRVRRRASFLQKARCHLLDHLRQPVQDMAASADGMSDPLYDPTSVRNAVDRYYSGDASSAADVERWLTHRLWLEALSREIP